MAIAFFILALLIVTSALGVILMKNPIHSALCLIITFLGVAGIFATLEAHFLATVQIIIYAGAIMVLVMFVIMLLNLKYEKNTGIDYLLWGVGAIGCGIFIAIAVNLFMGSMHVPLDYAPDSVGTVANIGRVLFTKYVFAFEAASILIMAAIVGSIVIAKSSYQRDE